MEPVASTGAGVDGNFFVFAVTWTMVYAWEMDVAVLYSGVTRLRVYKLHSDVSAKDGVKTLVQATLGPLKRFGEGLSPNL